MKDVTLLIAHPDDEALFCWPVLDRVKRIVCASSDKFNPQRDWCRERGKCLQEVGKLLGAEVTVFPHSSEFYRLPTRDGQLKTHAKAIMEELRGAEKIFTHNGWGEYGNIDHILCHHIVKTLSEETYCTVLTSDIAQEINWLPVKPWNLLREEHDDGIGGSNDLGNFKIDRPLFDRIKSIYDARGCWTWAWEPQAECQVFSV